MSNTTIETQATEAPFSQDLVEMVRTRITKSGACRDDYDLYVGVNVTGMVKYMSQVLKELLDAKNLAISISDSDIEAALLTILKCRCAQLNKRLPRGCFAGDIPIPDFFRPFVSQLASYENPLKHCWIHPYWLDDCRGEDTDGKTDGDETIADEELRHLERVARVLKVSGVQVTNGLPRQLTTGTDCIYRIKETERGELLVAGQDVSEVDVLVRSILRLQFLNCVFGEARTRYVSVEDLRSTIEIITTMALG